MHILENSTLKIFTETENDAIMTMKLKKYCLFVSGGTNESKVETGFGGLL